MEHDVREYFAKLPEERRQRLERLHALIVQLYPSAFVDLRYKMPTYNSSLGWISIGNQKNYISLYTCNNQHIEKFKLQHPSIKTGKGCINFQDKDELPLKDIEAVIHNAMENK